MLIVDPIETQHDGKYEMIVTNALGKVVSSANVIVEKGTRMR
jgi:hypothetical protein